MVVNLVKLEELEELAGLTRMPTDAANAWSSLDALSRCYYRPVIYLGSEEVESGLQFWFIARQTVIFPKPENRLVMLAITEQKEYTVGHEPTLVLAA